MWDGEGWPVQPTHLGHFRVQSSWVRRRWGGGGGGGGSHIQRWTEEGNRVGVEVEVERGGMEWAVRVEWGSYIVGSQGVVQKSDMSEVKRTS